MKVINIDKWKRKEYFNFFSEYDEPFFGIVSEIECTKAMQSAKESGVSFFSYYLHQSISAVNEIDEFKYRMEDGEVVVFDAIHASATIGRKDESFGFSFTQFSTDFTEFNTSFQAEIKRVKSISGLGLDGNAARNDVIHYSSLPWSKFTGLTHARHFHRVDTVPKITFGKAFLRDDNWYMAVAINAHHGFMDGVHISKYLERFQELLNK